MKFFKKRQNESYLEKHQDSFKILDEMDKENTLAQTYTEQPKTEDLIVEYTRLNELYNLNRSEEIRLKMVKISEQLTPVKQMIEEKKSRNPFKRKEKFEEKYCHTCKHNLKLHHKKGRSTGCRKCGCLRTLEEIMNPTDNGHKESNEVNIT